MSETEQSEAQIRNNERSAVESRMGDTMSAPADVIAAHQPQDLPSTQCRCGLDLDPDDNSQSQSWDGLHAQHVLDALKAAGYEVVQL